MKKLLIPIIVFIGISLSAIAQEKSKQELKGDKYAFRYLYDKAINSYSKAEQLTLEGQRKLAESYCRMGQNTETEIVYSKLVSQSGAIPEDYYNYAMVLKTNGKYDESGKWMDKFESVKPNDLRAKDYAANKSELNYLLKDDAKYKIGHLDVNTDADDFGTSYYIDKIVFASTKSTPKMIKRKYNLNGKPFLNMCVAEVDGGQLKNPENFSKSLNGKMHDGPASFSNNGTNMAFTRNNNKDKSKDKIVELQIWFSNNKDGKWSKPVPFALNKEEYSVGHPCLTADGNTMYFTSDMPGGFGGADIYRVTKIEKGDWGKAENLGDKINTESDEMFPFFEEKNATLFFASNGRFGLGGLDIFYCSMSGSGFGQVKNAGFPLNTQYDDFAVIVDDKLKKGYFSSSRTGGSGDDDIYTVDLLKGLEVGKKIIGIAMNKDGNAISKTFITLLDDKGNVIDTLTTKEDAAYSFFVATDKEFKLIGKKENYLDGNNVASTFGDEFIVKADLTLLQKEEPAVIVIVPQKIEEGADLAKIVALNSIYFDLDKSNIRQDAATELDKIVAIMNENPSMYIELRSYTDCRASKGYNQILSNKRAMASAEYIKERIKNSSRVSSKGYGETNLINDCACEGEVVSSCSKEEFQKNRRTEFIIVKKNGLVKK